MGVGERESTLVWLWRGCAGREVKAFLRVLA